MRSGAGTVSLAGWAVAAERRGEKDSTHPPAGVPWAPSDGLITVFASSLHSALLVSGTGLPDPFLLLLGI